MTGRNPEEGIERLLDINISFTPIPEDDFDDLKEDMDADYFEIYKVWICDAVDIISNIHPDFELLTSYVTDLDREENTCTIQLTTREDWMDRVKSDVSVEGSLKTFLEKKYTGSEVDVYLNAYDHHCDPWDDETGEDLE